MHYWGLKVKVNGIFCYKSNISCIWNFVSTDSKKKNDTEYWDNWEITRLRQSFYILTFLYNVCFEEKVKLFWLIYSHCHRAKTLM